MTRFAAPESGQGIRSDVIQVPRTLAATRRR